MAAGVCLSSGLIFPSYAGDSHAAENPERAAPRGAAGLLSGFAPRGPPVPEILRRVGDGSVDLDLVRASRAETMNTLWLCRALATSQAVAKPPQLSSP